MHYPFWTLFSTQAATWKNVFVDLDKDLWRDHEGLKANTSVTPTEGDLQAPVALEMDVMFQFESDRPDYVIHVKVPPPFFFLESKTCLFNSDNFRKP